jgi:toxin ParE1/3/4
VNTRVEFTLTAIADLDRILDHLLRHGVQDGASRIEDIIASTDILSRNPLIGRPHAGGARELVIGRGSRGDVALYRHIAAIDTIFVLAVRGQSESGYGGDREP